MSSDFWHSCDILEVLGLQSLLFNLTSTLRYLRGLNKSMRVVRKGYIQLALCYLGTDHLICRVLGPNCLSPALLLRVYIWLPYQRDLE